MNTIFFYSVLFLCFVVTVDLDPTIGAVYVNKKKNVKKCKIEDMAIKFDRENNFGLWRGEHDIVTISNGEG